MQNKYLAPAKINLYLNIIGKRSDGYHLIESVMHTIGLYDELEFYPLNDDRIEIVTIPDLKIPQYKNIVYRAAVILKKKYKTNQGIKIVLRKNIPLGSGLGGGSSDAATTLLVLNKLWNLGLSKKELVSLGSTLGADVPFFVTGGYAYVSGIGEKVFPYKHRLKLWLVLVNPDISVSTSKVYRQYDKLNLTKPEKLDKIKQIWQRRDKDTEVGAEIYNCLQPSAELICPEIKKIRQVLSRDKNVINTIMSGSGSTVYSIVSNKTIGEKIIKQLDGHPWKMWLVQTV